MTLDVRELAQLYAGYLPVRQLIRSGLIKPSSARAVKLLEKLAHVQTGCVATSEEMKSGLTRLRLMANSHIAT